MRWGQPGDCGSQVTPTRLWKTCIFVYNNYFLFQRTVLPDEGSRCQSVNKGFGGTLVFHALCPARR